jgi:prepilin-type N-terminal cleavage/methylation domain-containing protein
MKKGYSLVELMAVLAVIGLTVGLSLPALTKYFTRRAALDGLVREVCAVMRSARQEAITRNRQVGLVFDEGSDGRLQWRTYGDGNGNGVLKADIRRGVDRPLGPGRSLRIPEGRVRLGILNPGVPDVSTGRRIQNPEDPVKFGLSNICSFSPLGASSPGSIYFTDGIELQGVVRVYPGSAKVRILRWDEGIGWREF